MPSKPCTEQEAAIERDALLKTDQPPNYYTAFAQYLTTGDAGLIRHFLVDEQSVERLAVYRNGFFKSAVGALAANYPVTQQVLTEPLFNALAQQYIGQYPPARGTLVGYGEQFVTLLHNRALLRDFSLPEITADLARLDYAWLRSLQSAENAESTAVLSADRVMTMAQSATDPASCNVQLASSVVLVLCQFNAFELWQRVRASGQVPSHFSLVEAPQAMLFWRCEGSVQAKVLTDAEQFFFAELSAAPSVLGELLAATLERFCDFEITEHFAHCLQYQLLALACPTQFAAQ